jgi:demethylmenaquinone methyltransferase/2-methoxy-6-polyprenyl-1,4-benzoquinol methylase
VIEQVQTVTNKPRVERRAKNYDRAAWFYEAAATAFSLGQIRAAKEFAVSVLEPGQRVIFLGAGTGEDALFAAQRGCQVTALDISQKMLARLQARLRQKNLQAEIVCQSAFDHERVGFYDACLANFFFNVFRRDDMLRMMRHSVSLLRPGGKLVIADVAQAKGNPLYKAFNVVYLKSAMFSYWLMGLVPLHRNYNYASYFPDVGLQLDHIEHFRLFPAGPIVYQVTVGRKGGES